jgi:hypothetical protein
MVPVCIFVYNRPRHAFETLKALEGNLLAREAEVTIFSDAPKDEAQVELVTQTRGVLRETWNFKSLEIVERMKNMGLSSSIVSGVNEMMEKYGKAVVLEDDLVTAPCFLSYMAEALDRYQEEPGVWHIAGHCESFPGARRGAAFITRFMDCWGWATWKDRWDRYEKDPDSDLKYFTPYRRFRFDMEGSDDHFSQIKANAEGRRDSWAVFWYSTIFKEGGLCLSPEVSLVANRGFDGSGTNSGSGRADYYDPSNRIEHYPSRVVEDRRCRSRIVRARSRRTHRSLFHRYYRLLRRLVTASLAHVGPGSTRKGKS